MNTITPAYPSIAALQAYQIGKPVEELTREYGITDIIKLASNENPMGCSPKVAAAITAQLSELSRYPDGAGYTLKQDIANFYSVKPEQITLGNGSNELLNIIAYTFASNQDAIVYSQYAFSVYQLATMSVSAQAIEVPAVNYGHDLPAMLQAIKANPNTKIVFIANPNNPTGTVLSRDAIQDFVRQVPANVLVVLDEAYYEFAPESGNLAILGEFPNVMILRTFSKAYGLAGLRIGYAISSAYVADMLNRTRQAFNTNLLAQSAAAAALADQAFVKQYCEMNAEQKQALYQGFEKLGLKYVNSATNFILLNVGKGNEVYQKLLEKGVIVRPMAGYGLPEWVRVSIGLPAENARFLASLGEILAK